ncbi:hypothetical protein CGCSCA4_v007444 [Colletotrichum siamense]|uniref:Uncharacterized protein n=1 Tax=Colletotrichum siamense TaxID=690259 RepID=A0A9P5BMQ8_COLSI|nr:hypothetical protein CGCSCA2_v014639 [Colletotrichum siamense]KAF4844612.1 hypothetical protein CGCSCA4_v007444 [Colletotrichum siamense]
MLLRGNRPLPASPGARFRPPIRADASASFRPAIPAVPLPHPHQPGRTTGTTTLIDKSPFDQSSLVSTFLCKPERRGSLGLLCEHLVLCVHRITSHHPCATLVLSDNPPVRHIS